MCIRDRDGRAKRIKKFAFTSVCVYNRLRVDGAVVGPLLERLSHNNADVNNKNNGGNNNNNNIIILKEVTQLFWKENSMDQCLPSLAFILIASKE